MYKNIFLTLSVTAALICNLQGYGQTINTYAGNGVAGFSGDGGPATAAQLNNPYGVAVDAVGNVYIADNGNNRIRKINTTGVITTIAGNGVASYGGDNGPATAAAIQAPRGIAVDPSGNVVFSDYGNNRIRKINTATGIITTIAGVGGVPSFGGDGGQATAANLAFSWGIAFGQAGNMAVADNQNCRVRLVNGSGIINTIAGTGSCFIGGDGGQATAAKLQYPTGVAYDGTGNLFIADDGNNRVRKVAVTGIISTVTGSPTYGFTGDGGPSTAAKVYYPRGIATDNAGNIYICDMNNFRIRKINPFGIINTIAGSGAGTSSGGSGGFSGDGGPATAAQLSHTTGVAVQSNGIIYIADNDNNRIRYISSLHNPLFVGGHNQTDSLCINGSINIDTLMAISDVDAGQTETWSVITAPAHGTLVASYTATSTGGVIIPTGLSYTPAAGYSGTDVFSVVVNDGSLSDTTTVSIRVFPIPVAGTITGVDSVCPGKTVTLSDTATGGLWQSLSTGVATVDPVTGIVTGVTPGTSTIAYSITNPCGTDTAYLSMVVRSYIVCHTEVNNIANALKGTIDVTPNPNNGLFSINCLADVKEDIIVTITNMLGTKVKVFTIPANKSSEIRFDYPAGNYFISAHSDHIQFPTKIVTIK